MTPQERSTNRGVIPTWQQTWKTSATRQLLLWYRDAWRAQPMRQTGVILLTALLVYAIGQLGRPVSWHQWWVWIALGGVGVLGLFRSEEWGSIRRGSRVLQWLNRQRTH